MYKMDPGILATRGNVGWRARKERGNFISLGPNWVHSLDGNNKLMGYQNSTFPIAMYGCIDTASRNVLWIHFWTNNSDPQLVGHCYMQYVLKTKMMAVMLRVDRGTETATLATIHALDTFCGKQSLLMKHRMKMTTKKSC